MRKLNCFEQQKQRPPRNQLLHLLLFHMLHSFHIVFEGHPEFLIGPELADMNASSDHCALTLGSSRDS